MFKNFTYFLFNSVRHCGPEPQSAIRLFKMNYGRVVIYFIVFVCMLASCKRASDNSGFLSGSDSIKQTVDGVELTVLPLGPEYFKNNKEGEGFSVLRTVFKYSKDISNFKSEAELMQASTHPSFYLESTNGKELPVHIDLKSFSSEEMEFDVYFTNTQLANKPLVYCINSNLVSLNRIVKVELDKEL